MNQIENSQTRSSYFSELRDLQNSNREALEKLFSTMVEIADSLVGQEPPQDQSVSTSKSATPLRAVPTGQIGAAIQQEREIYSQLKSTQYQADRLKVL